MADKLTVDSEVQKATVTHVRKSGRQTRKDWQAYPVRSHRRRCTVVTTNCEKSAEAIVCDLKVVTLIAEMLLLLSRSIPIDKCLVRNEQCKAIETK